MAIRMASVNCLPDDIESSSYRFIIVAAKRARQLQNGQRSYLPTTSRKPTITAMEEVRRGLVEWNDPTLALAEEQPQDQ